mgnify:CR=1 FL=1
MLIYNILHIKHIYIFIQEKNNLFRTSLILQSKKCGKQFHCKKRFYTLNLNTHYETNIYCNYGIT